MSEQYQGSLPRVAVSYHELANFISHSQRLTIRCLGEIRVIGLARTPPIAVVLL